MEYLPTLTLNFPGGATNAYRIHNGRVEFKSGEGEWRVLEPEDVQLHFSLHTEVSKWLLKFTAEAAR